MALAIKYFYCKCHAMISKMHNFCRSVRDSSIYKNNNKYAIFGQPRLCRKKHFILKFNANKRVCLEEKNYTHLIKYFLVIFSLMNALVYIDIYQQGIH